MKYIANLYDLFTHDEIQKSNFIDCVSFKVACMSQKILHKRMLLPFADLCLHFPPSAPKKER